jgi:putative Mg2+ transporter-C (MgtC) family protein
MHSEWELLWRLGLALVLSTTIGLERELRQKSAGLRTYTLVGLGSALFLLVSEYGFVDTLSRSHVVLDPSRVAAQIVSGIGFIGGGLIFVRRDSVRGLTTAAGVWLTAAVGMAAGGGLPVLAVASTIAYLVIATAYPVLTRRLPGFGLAPSPLRITYRDGHGVLREALAGITAAGFDVSDLNFARLSEEEGGDPRAVAVRLELRGRHSLTELASDLGELDGVLAVHVVDANADPD